ncbi:MAG: DNA phosphorothioation-associated putative methyltransferase [Proteobacteria bacterium]|nr:DNA phosphorothioation-associated putative methyltransferase [Pseudomonadota bacterium]
MQHLGKQVGSRRYVPKEHLSVLPEVEAALVETAKARLPMEAEYNLVRVDADRGEVGFLHYPGLGSEPFPALLESWRVHVGRSLLTHRKYAASLNAPILHRTELLLAEDHPRRAAFQNLTRTCEELGLFDNSTIIGFRRNWSDLITSKGFVLVDAELVPLGNATSQLGAASDRELIIQRHRTALSRSSISAPVQCLLRDRLLTQQDSFFDYGCGRGDDLAALTTNGFRCDGWDPYYRPHVTRESADVVNLGFVINVIEDYDERVEALLSAYALARKVVSVAAMLTTNVVEKFSAYKDGVITRRSTFQKYYSQAELQHFIELVLSEDAYSAAPGVFYVFRDRDVEQGYLLRKAGGGSRNTPVVLKAKPALVQVLQQPPASRRSPRSREYAPEDLVQLDTLWQLCIDRGRALEPHEVPIASELKERFGAYSKALRMCLERHDAGALEEAARQRRSDIVVMLALRMFERRRQLARLDNAFARDIRALFRSMRAAEIAARDVLFSIRDQQTILDACRTATVTGLGYFEEDQALHIHTSLVGRLPAVLRVFVGCASAMAGDLSAYDVAKIHIGSGKVTLLLYDDFEGKPLPCLLRRVKVRFRDQETDVFEYGGRFPSTLLFQKSRYINEEYPHYAEQVAFEEALAVADLLDTSPHGPTTSDYGERLRAARYQIVDFRVLRCDDIPALDEKCGAHLRFRDLIECGETWERLRPDNQPRGAESFNALCDLARYVLDPLVEYYGSIKLTYGFGGPKLTRHIPARIAPHLDQHAACEINRVGQHICSRLGAAVDLLVEYEDMREVASWIASNCDFDRIYFYGSDRPIHVSIGPERSREVYELVQLGSRRVPRKLIFNA